jgi:hypothetical protein
MRSLLMILSLVAAATVAGCNKNKNGGALAGGPAKDPQTEAECNACNGKWAAHGMEDMKTCLCPAADVGKRCRDGKDCIGECVAVDGQTEVVDKGPPPKGYFVGKCSQYHKLYGCFKMLLDGTVAQGPQPLDQPAQEICID